ncbi:MAG: ABC transporter permease [Eubacteriaceae bacterium]|nr:ABC transporter permease [Eubacteriaceae bacterium]
MIRYVVVRTIRALATIWLVWSLVFFLSRLTGDPVKWILGEFATKESYETVASSLHLDLPLWEQYMRTLSGLVRGDMGMSYYHRRPVADLFLQRLGPTMALQSVVIVATSAIGILFGVVAAVKHDKLVDKAIRFFTIVGCTIPNFVFAVLLIFLFCLKLKWLPSGNIGSFRHYVLPFISLSIGPIASISRLTRSAMLDTLSQEYIDVARMKGISESAVIIKHGLRNALFPVVTVLGGQIVTLVGGAFVVESVFSLPGIGTLSVTAAQTRDFPLLQYCVFIMIATFTFVNLLVDLSYAALDPRIRDGEWATN